MAPSGAAVRDLEVSEAMRDGRLGMVLQLRLDENGVGSLPSGLADSTLTISGVGRSSVCANGTGSRSTCSCGSTDHQGPANIRDWALGR